MPRDTDWIEVYRPLNPDEALRVREVLESANIPHEMEPVPADGVLPPTLLEWGYVFVPSSREGDARELLDEHFGIANQAERKDNDKRWAPEPIQDPNEANEPTDPTDPTGLSFGGWVAVGLLLISVVANVFLYTKLTTLWRAEDRYGNPTSDADYRFNSDFPTVVYTLDKKGKRIAAWYDHNDDGRAEKYSYLRDGDVIATGEDKNGDALFEVSTLFSKSQAILRSVDRNANGNYEYSYTPDGDKEGWPRFYDDDDDGVTDRVECQSQGRTRVLSIDRCDVE